jgi:hypothetical protein
MDATLMEIKRLQVDDFEVLLTYSEEGGFVVAYKKNGSSYTPPNGILPIVAGDKLVWRLDAGQSIAEFEIVFEPRDQPPHRPVALAQEESPEENVISGDVPDGNGPRRMTRVRTARRLQAGENTIFSYTVFSQGKESDPPFFIKLTGLLE